MKRTTVPSRLRLLVRHWALASAQPLVADKVRPSAPREARWLAPRSGRTTRAFRKGHCRVATTSPTHNAWRVTVTTCRAWTTRKGRLLRDTAAHTGATILHHHLPVTDGAYE